MFALLVVIVTLACGLSLLGLLVLALVSKDPPTVMEQKFADACDFTLKVTIGALVGLLGGRAAAPDRIEIGEKE